MYGGRRHLEVTLDISLCWRVSVDLAVVVDEGQILPLFLGLCRSHLTGTDEKWTSLMLRILLRELNGLHLYDLFLWPGGYMSYLYQR